MFGALADPMRRSVVVRLADVPSTASDLALDAPVSRQAIAKHLSILEAAGLVIGERDGRRVVYRLTPGPLADAASWMGVVGSEWDRRLARMHRALERRR